MEESLAEWAAQAQCRQREQPVRLVLGPGKEDLMQALKKIGEALSLGPHARDSALAERALQFLVDGNSVGGVQRVPGIVGGLHCARCKALVYRGVQSHPSRAIFNKDKLNKRCTM